MPGVEPGRAACNRPAQADVFRLPPPHFIRPVIRAVVVHTMDIPMQGAPLSRLHSPSRPAWTKWPRPRLMPASSHPASPRAMSTPNRKARFRITTAAAAPTPQRTPHRHPRGLVPASLRPWGSKLKGQEQDWTQQRVSPDTSGQASFFHPLHDPRPDSGVVTMPPARSIPKPAHAATQHRHVAATAGKTRKSSPPCLP